MKKEIHPKYYPKARIKCACGRVLEVGSTKAEMRVEICSQCHPFYTGREKIIETGQVEKFREKLAKAALKKKTGQSKKKKREKRLARKRNKKKP